MVEHSQIGVRSPKIIPYKWLGSVVPKATTDWYHDQAVKGPDCIIYVTEFGTKTTSGKSILWAFDISAVVGVPRLKAAHVRGRVNLAGARHRALDHWRATTSNRTYAHSYAYVKGGRSVGKPPRCPAEFPDRGWTHASNDDELHLL